MAVSAYGVRSPWTGNRSKRIVATWGGSWGLVCLLRDHRILSMSQQNGSWDLGLSYSSGSFPGLFLHCPFQFSMWYQATPEPMISGNPGAPINAGTLFTVLCVPGENPPLVLFKKHWASKRTQGNLQEWLIAGLAPSCFSSWSPPNTTWAIFWYLKVMPWQHSHFKCFRNNFLSPLAPSNLHFSPMSGRLNRKANRLN